MLLQVGYAAAAFYGYVGVIGLGLWLAFKWLFRANLTLPQVWCTYGKLALELWRRHAVVIAHVSQSCTCCSMTGNATESSTHCPQPRRIQGRLC